MVNNSYTIEQIQIIGGTYFSITFNVKDENGDIVDINGATINWKMRQYGEFYTTAVVSKSTAVSSEVLITNASTGTFKVFINANDTAGLAGKFVHQPIITDFAGKTFIPAQGIIVIDKKIT